MYTFTTRYMEFMQVYKVNVLIVQWCTRLPSLKEFNLFSKTCWPFPFSKDRGHSSHTLFDDTLIPCIFLTSYMFIQLPTPLMMNRNMDWVQFFPFSLRHDNGSIVNPLICTHCILGLWNLCKCARYLHLVYNVNVLIVQWCIKLPFLNEGIQLIFKN